MFVASRSTWLFRARRGYTVRPCRGVDERKLRKLWDRKKTRAASRTARVSVWDLDVESGEVQPGDQL